MEKNRFSVSLLTYGFFMVLTLFIYGCATKMAYINTQKTAEVVKEDKSDCQALVDASDFKDASLKQNKINQCMQGKGYKVVSSEEAEKIQGFTDLWINPNADFKIYDAIFIDGVDVSQAKDKNTTIPNTKVSENDISSLGEQMHERFSKTLNALMPVVSQEESVNKKALCINLRLNDIAQTNVGINTAIEAAGQLSGLPLPDAPSGSFSFECTVSDFSTKDKLISISSETSADKNASLAGLEKFERWKRAYNIMDYWADHLAALLAKSRGQKYKSQLKFIKVIDF